MIAVCLTTYNQENFIGQAIESVLKQRCDEPLRLYIGDDASTDNTSVICADYATKNECIVLIRREQNIGIAANTIDLYQRIVLDECEYIAMLDGDDYWIDDQKLQLELNYLRANHNVGLVHTASYDEIDGKYIDTDFENKPVGDVSLTYNLRGALHTNSTVVFRTALLRHLDLDLIKKQNFVILDYPLYGIFSQFTHFGYIYQYTTVWRNHSSVSHPIKLQAFFYYTRERIRMWKWLDQCFPHRFHYSKKDAFIWFCGQVIALFRKKYHFYLHK